MAYKTEKRINNEDIGSCIRDDLFGDNRTTAQLLRDVQVLALSDKSIDWTQSEFLLICLESRNDPEIAAFLIQLVQDERIQNRTVYAMIGTIGANGDERHFPFIRDYFDTATEPMYRSNALKALFKLAPVSLLASMTNYLTDESYQDIHTDLFFIVKERDEELSAKLLAELPQQLVNELYDDLSYSEEDENAYLSSNFQDKVIFSESAFTVPTPQQVIALTSGVGDILFSTDLSEDEYERRKSIANQDETEHLSAAIKKVISHYSEMMSIDHVWELETIKAKMKQSLVLFVDEEVPSDPEGMASWLFLYAHLFPEEALKQFLLVLNNIDEKVLVCTLSSLADCAAVSGIARYAKSSDALKTRLHELLRSSDHKVIEKVLKACHYLSIRVPTSILVLLLRQSTKETFYYLSYLLPVNDSERIANEEVFKLVERIESAETVLGCLWRYSCHTTDEHSAHAFKFFERAHRLYITNQTPQTPYQQKIRYDFLLPASGMKPPVEAKDLLVEIIHTSEKGDMGAHFAAEQLALIDPLEAAYSLQSIEASSYAFFCQFSALTREIIVNEMTRRVLSRLETNERPGQEDIIFLMFEGGKEVKRKLIQFLLEHPHFRLARTAAYWAQQGYVGSEVAAEFVQELSPLQLQRYRDDEDNESTKQYVSPIETFTTTLARKNCIFYYDSEADVIPPFHDQLLATVFECLGVSDKLGYIHQCRTASILHEQTWAVEVGINRMALGFHFMRCGDYYRATWKELTNCILEQLGYEHRIASIVDYENLVFVPPALLNTLALKYHLPIDNDEVTKRQNEMFQKTFS